MYILYRFYQFCVLLALSVWSLPKEHLQQLHHQPRQINNPFPKSLYLTLYNYENNDCNAGDINIECNALMEENQTKPQSIIWSRTFKVITLSFWCRILFQLLFLLLKNVGLKNCSNYGNRTTIYIHSNNIKTIMRWCRSIQKNVSKYTLNHSTESINDVLF